MLLNFDNLKSSEIQESLEAMDSVDRVTASIKLITKPVCKKNLVLALNDAHTEIESKKLQIRKFLLEQKSVA